MIKGKKHINGARIYDEKAKNSRVKVKFIKVEFKLTLQKETLIVKMKFSKKKQKSCFQYNCRIQIFQIEQFHFLLSLECSFHLNLLLLAKSSR